MFYKNWPYWLKGGIITGIIFTVYFFIVYGYEINFSCTPVTCGIITATLNLPSILVVSFFVRLGFFSVIGNMFGVIVSKSLMAASIPVVNFITGFLLGALMGLIYEKIKNRN